MLKYFILALIILWMGLCSYIGMSLLLNVPAQMVKDKAFFENSIRPPAEFVKKFKLDYKRLPTNEEFNQNFKDNNGYEAIYIRDSKHIFSEDADEFVGANWQNDFAIGVWRGKWEEYYFSWTDSYGVNNYSWKDGLIDMSFCALVGIIPLIIFLLIKRRRFLDTRMIESHS